MQSDRIEPDLDVRLLNLLALVLESDDELFSFFASSRYALLLLTKVLLKSSQQSGLSKEECLKIGQDMRSRTHRQDFIEEAVRRGFFEKKQSPHDGRQVVITPTERTKLLFKEWASAYHQVRRSTFGGD
jgi:hypothetical protein